MPLYTVISQDGTVSIETKVKIAEEITRIHTTVKGAEELCPRGLPLVSDGSRIYWWRAGSHGLAQLCTAKRAYPSGESRHAAAALDDVLEPDRNRNGSALSLFRKSHPAMPWKWARFMQTVGHE
jgi:hypothetical protein